jgi:hypothetical protein
MNKSSDIWKTAKKEFGKIIKWEEMTIWQRLECNAPLLSV